MIIAVVGGGAAGYFAAIHAKMTAPKADVILMEAAESGLAKVKISGGGRCNVTHACFNPRQLADYYPRGGKALIGPFTRFGPADTVEWFEHRGVQLKTEIDNRMFPITDNSQTIIDCLLGEAERLEVKRWMNCRVTTIRATNTQPFEITLADQQVISAARVILTTGSSRHGHELAQSLGHTIVPPMPSLFTFKLNDPDLTALSGVSVAHVRVTLKGNQHWVQEGPLLITHWGVSGPAIIKLSAWAARDCFEHQYRMPLVIRWLSQYSEDEISRRVAACLVRKRVVAGDSPFAEIPGRLWARLCQKCKISDQTTWSNVSKVAQNTLIQCLMGDSYVTDGKGVFKDEFVTCGGVDLAEIEFKTMSSRRCPGLYFAGEIIDVDGVTGGFNFQNAWTTGYLAGIGSATGI